MPSAPAALKKYKRLFRKLGEPEGFCMLRTITQANSVHAEPVIEDIGLYKPIVDDPIDRQTFGLLTTPDVKIFDVWGGAINIAGNFLVTEAAYKSAAKLGGGVIYYGRLLPIIDFKRGFSMDSFAGSEIVMEWFLITEGIRGAKIVTEYIYDEFGNIIIDEFGNPLEI